MRIIVDKEAKQIVTQLCDIALKMGGLSNVQTVTMVLNVMENTDGYCKVTGNKRNAESETEAPEPAVAG